jgi:1A family penicillin-binding protein
MPIPQLNKKRGSRSSVRVIVPKNTSAWKKKTIRKRKKRKKKGLLKKLIFWFFILSVVSLFLGSLAIGGTILWLSKDLPEPDKLIERKVPLSTKIFDRTGENVLYEIHGEQKRTFVPLEEIPDYAVKAIISIEDKNFFEHKGISLWGIFRGVVIEKLKGNAAQGGSTLTQQLIKNAILTNERKISRKIKEWILAWQIEKQFSKEEILQLYFNEIPYGSTAYGIESASNLYFDKSAKDLTVAESAVLASLPQAPTYYSPYGSHKDKLIGRQQYVLGLMKEQEYIDEQQYNDAINEELVFKRRRENIIAPHFVMYIKELLTSRYGEKMVEQGGLQVITTLDTYKQEKAEEAIEKYVEQNEEKYNAKNASLVSLDAKTGQILSMVGSRDYFNIEQDGNVNVSIRLRQPGSSLKPLVYATAFTLGYTPDTIIYDVETNFGVQGAKEYIPHNYDDSFRGPVSIRSSLAGSLNIPAVKALYLTGLDKVTDYAKKMGYTSLDDKNRFGLSLVLGGGEVRLLEHVGAYSVFARDGNYNPVTGILEIKDSTGKIIEEFKKKEVQVMDSQSVRLLNNVLSDNNARAYAFGENNYLNLGDRPVAAKTGTTNDYKDAWTIGYTPSLVTGVWVGNNDGEQMKRGAGGSTVAGPIWHNYMETVLGKAGSGSPIEKFQAPKEIDKEKYKDRVILIGEIAGEETLKIDKFSGKLATEFTPEEAIEEKTFKQLHNILHYINKKDPLGLLPEDPTKDSQYIAWEEGISNWLKEEQEPKEGEDDSNNQLTIELPPVEFDDVHTPENKPSINILNVKKDQLINTEEFFIDVEVSAPREINKVEYRISGNLVYTSTQAPYDLRWIVDMPNGGHNLKATVFDDVLNQTEATIPIQISIIDKPLQIIWISPYDNQNIYEENYPLPLSFVLSRLSRIKKIDIFYKDINNNSQLITSIIKPSSKNLAPSWGAIPSPGTYNIYTVITDIYDKKTIDKGITINIQ